MAGDGTHPDGGKRSLIARALRPTWAERKRMLRVEAWIFVGVSYGLIAFAHVWPPDFRNPSPAYVGTAWVAFMVRTLASHIGLILLVIAAVSAWVRQRRLLIAVLPLVVVTLGPDCWTFRPRSAPGVVGERVTVMSVNLLSVNRQTQAIIDEIRAADPDLLLLQEYTEHWHDALGAAIGQAYPHVAHNCREDSFGVAIYSRRPFQGPVTMRVPLGQDAEPQMRAAIRIADLDVAVYNIHLLPPRRLDYIVESRLQFADLLEVLSSESLPVMLAGDFNFSANSPHADILGRLGFVDAHEVGGWGRGTTWPVNGFFRWIPGLRLDHVYLRGGLTCATCRTGTGYGSDHRPVICEIGLAR